MCDALLIIATFMSASATITIAIFTKTNIELTKSNLKLSQEIKEHHISNIAATIYAAALPSKQFKPIDFKAIRNQIKYTEIFDES